MPYSKPRTPLELWKSAEDLQSWVSSYLGKVYTPSDNLPKISSQEDVRNKVNSALRSPTFGSRTGTVGGTGLNPLEYSQRMTEGIKAGRSPQEIERSLRPPVEEKKLPESKKRQNAFLEWFNTATSAKNKGTASKALVEAVKTGIESPKDSRSSSPQVLSTEAAPITPSTIKSVVQALEGNTGIVEGVKAALETGTAYVAWSIYSIPDNLFMLNSMITNRVMSLFTYNSKTGKRYQLEDKTLSQALSDVAKSAGMKDIDVSKISNPDLKNAAIDINEGRNILSGLSARTYTAYKNEEMALRERASKATKFAMDVAGSIPQMALMALPHGMVAYATSAYSGSLNENMDYDNIALRDFQYSIYNASVDVASEMVFGLFGNTTALFRGGLSKVIGKEIAPTVGMIVKSTIKNAAEEGFEEMLAFPFQLALDWKYKNPDKSLLDVVKSADKFDVWDMAKQTGYAGLVGFVAGGLMTVGSVTKSQIPRATRSASSYAQAGGTSPDAFMSLRYTDVERAELNDLATKIMNKPLNDLTESDVTTFFDSFAQGIKKDNPVMLPILGLTPPTQGPPEAYYSQSAARKRTGTPINTPDQNESIRTVNPINSPDAPLIKPGVLPDVRSQDFTDRLDKKNYVVEGTTIQEKNKSVLIQQLATVDELIETAESEKNNLMVIYFNELKDTLQSDLDKVENDPTYNPLNYKEGVEPATTVYNVGDRKIIQPTEIGTAPETGARGIEATPTREQSIQPETAGQAEASIGSGQPATTGASAEPGRAAVTKKVELSEIKPTDQAIKDNVGYHYGDLGKSEFLSNQTGTRGTGHYGTGTYFVTDAEAIARMQKGTSYSQRPIQEVSLSGYNLYKPSNRKQADDLHEFLKDINKRSVGSTKVDNDFELYNNAMKLFGTKNIGTEEAFIEKVKAISNQAQSDRPADEKAMLSKGKRLDSASTRLMKDLGYEGVDVRGIKGFDDEQYGTVVYDLKQPKAAVTTKTDSEKPKTRTRKMPILKGDVSGYKVPDEGYNKHLMELARKIVAPARYQRMKEGIAGTFRRVEVGDKVDDKILLRSVTATRTMAHETGHALDYKIHGTTIADGNIKGRFPDSKLNNKQLTAAAKSVSKLMRPTDNWTEYRDDPSELMSDVYSLYLMDQDMLKRVSPEMFNLIDKSIKGSKYAGYVKETVDNVTYKEKSDAAKALRTNAKNVPIPLIDGKGHVNRVKKLWVQNQREKAAFAASKKFIKRDLMRDFTADERKDMGAHIESMVNIETNEAPVMTKKTLEGVKKYRYEIEKAREELNKIADSTGDSQYIGFLENYITHLYVNDAKAKDFARSYSTKMKSAKKRKFPTLKEAMDAGLTPLTQDIGVLYGKYIDMNANAAFNIKFMRELNDIMTDAGTPVIMKAGTEMQGMKYVDHPAVAQIYAGKDSKGKTVLWKGGAYVDPQVYKAMKQLFERPFDSIVLKRLLQTTAMMKNTSLTLSFFHYGNITESAMAVLGANSIFTRFNGKLMMTKNAGKFIMDEPEVVRDALLAGLAVDPFSDAMTGTVKTMYDNVNAMTRSVPILKTLLPKLQSGQEWMQDKLWNNYVTPLKIYSYYKLTADALAKLPDNASQQQIDGIKQDVAEYLNDAYGGQEWSKKFWTSPNGRKILQLTVMAPDYSISNFNIAFKRPIERAKQIGAAMKGEKVKEEYPGQNKMKDKLFARYWIQMMIAIYGVLNVVQYALNGTFTDENEPGQKIAADVTPIYKGLEKVIPGYDAGDRRYFMSPGKQFKEVLRYITDPLEIVGAKMSPLARLAIEQITGSQAGSGWDTDFKGLEFYESLGPRALNVMDKFVPFSFQGSNFLMTFPLRKGMSWYKAQKAYEDIIRAQVDPSIFNGTMSQDRAQILKAEIDKAAELNGLDPKEHWKQATSKVRSEYYAKFWNSLNDNKMDKVDDYARILLVLDVNQASIRQSGTSRKLSDEEIRKGIIAYREKQRESRGE